MIGSRTCGIWISFLGEAGSVLRRKEAGTGEPDTSMVMLSHAGGSSSSNVVEIFFASAQSTLFRILVALLFRFSSLVTKGAS